MKRKRDDTVSALGIPLATGFFFETVNKNIAFYQKRFYSVIVPFDKKKVNKIELFT